MPAPGGRRKANNSSVTPLVAVRNLRPPPSPSRTSTEAAAELTALFAVCSKSSSARTSDTVSELDTSIEEATSLSCSANDFGLALESGGFSLILHVPLQTDGIPITLRCRIIQMRMVHAKKAFALRQ